MLSAIWVLLLWRTVCSLPCSSLLYPPTSLLACWSAAALHIALYPLLTNIVCCLYNQILLLSKADHYNSRVKNSAIATNESDPFRVTSQTALRPASIICYRLRHSPLSPAVSCPWPRIARLSCFRILSHRHNDSIRRLFTLVPTGALIPMVQSFLPAAPT